MENNRSRKRQPRFDIDFFEFSFLVEACIPPRPIARAMFWDDVIWKYYDVLTENERMCLLDWIQLNPSFKKENEDCMWFFDRFNQYNQFIVTTLYDGEVTEHECFRHDGKFWIKRHTFIAPEYVTEVKKKVSANRY